MFKSLSKCLLAAVFVFVLTTSCDPPCNQGFLWISNSTSSSFFLQVDGYYSGNVSPGRIVKLEVIPNTPIEYKATKASNGNGASTASDVVSVDDCQTLAVEIG